MAARMANLIRSAKSGSDWSYNDLLTYNISVQSVTGTQFFGVSLSEVVPVMDEEFASFNCDSGEKPTGPKRVRNLVRNMESATKTGNESAVDEFAYNLLVTMDYDKGERMVHMRVPIQLEVCGVSKMAQTDVCVMRDDLSVLLMVQEDKTVWNPRDPEPQAIAEAIAAFQENNRVRNKLGLSVLKDMMIPCITMVGTFPHFYLVPVTQHLSSCVATGQYPDVTTTVSRYIPRVPRRVSDGMRPVENRREILRCFEAFKVFVDDLESCLAQP